MWPHVHLAQKQIKQYSDGLQPDSSNIQMDFNFIYDFNFIFRWTSTLYSDGLQLYILNITETTHVDVPGPGPGSHATILIIIVADQVRNAS